MPLAPLPGAALLRAVLRTLRVSEDGYTLSGLVQTLVVRDQVAFDSEVERMRFEARVEVTTKRLAARGVLHFDGCRYTILAYPQS